MGTTEFSLLGDPIEGGHSLHFQNAAAKFQYLMLLWLLLTKLVTRL